MEEILSKIEENVSKVMIGKTKVTKLLLASLAGWRARLARGYCRARARQCLRGRWQSRWAVRFTVCAVYAGSAAERCDRTVIFQSGERGFLPSRRDRFYQYFAGR